MLMLMLCVRVLPPPLQSLGKVGVGPRMNKADTRGLEGMIIGKTQKKAHQRMGTGRKVGFSAAPEIALPTNLNYLPIW
jgi:hypothetical protein